MAITIDTGENWPEVDFDEFYERKSLNLEEDEVEDFMLLALDEIKSNFDEDELPETWTSTQALYFKMALYQMTYSLILPTIRKYNNFHSGEEMEDNVDTEADKIRAQSISFQSKIPGFISTTGSTFTLIEPASETSEYT